MTDSLEEAARKRVAAKKARAHLLAKMAADHAREHPSPAVARSAGNPKP